MIYYDIINLFLNVLSFHFFFWQSRQAQNSDANLILWTERDKSYDTTFQLTTGPTINILIIMPPKELNGVGPN